MLSSVASGFLSGELSPTEHAPPSPSQLPHLGPGSLIDTTGDGIADSVLMDTTGDGRVNTILRLDAPLDVSLNFEATDCFPRAYWEITVRHATCKKTSVSRADHDKSLRARSLLQTS